ncbi:MAG: UDP-N-acetylmuramate dehydrogenase [Clostridia bacterium]|nr:UDP-N-acetylmuramate dehydrogenase [Clostridia bacterium]
MERFFEEISRITKVTENEPMKKHTTFRIGGPARFFAEPATKEELKALLSKAKEFEVAPIVIGRGSNLLVADEGLDTLVISLGERFSDIEVKGNEIYASAGASLSAIAQAALKNSLTGFEFASGIPGSLGGAVYMNAGAYGGEMKDIVVKSYYLDENLCEQECTEHEFSYRKSFYTGKMLVITGAKIVLSEGDAKEIGDAMAALAKKRREKQPIQMPSAGSVFKRPEGYFAGTLIEEAGLKGYRIGGAEVSTLHAGFIVNAGDATCKDVLGLISHIQKTVYEKNGVMLETEVKKIG